MSEAGSKHAYPVDTLSTANRCASDTITYKDKLIPLAVLQQRRRHAGSQTLRISSAVMTTLIRIEEDVVSRSDNIVGIIRHPPVDIHVLFPDEIRQQFART